MGSTRVAALAIGWAACGGGGGGGGGRPPDVDAPMGPTWWQPKLGQAKDWDIQLSAKPGDVDVSAPRLMYDLDLWALVPSPTMLDYGDGQPAVMVPAGALAGTIAQLHARTPSTVVICHVETGALEMNRPDAGKFPAAAIGGDVPDLAMAKFLDLRKTSRMAWQAVMFKRFDLARQIGCDGIEPSHNDVGIYTSGFNIPTEDTYSWYTEIAKQGHDRMLSTGMKDADLIAGAVDGGAAAFDWLMIERCGEFMTCDFARPFINLNKAVFAIDYNIDSGDPSTDPPTPPAPQSAAGVCLQQRMAMIDDGLYKDVALTKAVRTPCEP